MHLTAGQIQTLFVKKTVSFGVYLSAGEASDGRDAGEEEVLLPAKEVPEGTKTGDALRVFLYFDSEDRLIATVREPKIVLGGVARLTVSQVTKVGAFMDWGLEKDVLLPYAEQTRRVREGEEVLCALYADKSGRLAVTMNVYPYLRTDSPYRRDEKVTGTVYETSGNFGTFVAVDDIFSALIPAKEVFEASKIGETVTARVTEVRPDGKLTLSLRDKAYVQMEQDARRLMEVLKKEGGSLPLGDKSDAEAIRSALKMSKAAFKRAAGRLYKEGQIRVGEKTIELTYRTGDEKTKES
ncbi:MAG: RNA-binding protein [Lachnospiraceae bacterium]|nr:RNA-binding protein [Lachnospiraceae bacterium]